jgi:beta-arabinofuranosyltransferase
VPNWLREELLKKKSAPLSAPTQQLSQLDSMESNDIEQPLRRPDQSDSRSNDSAKSTEDDEDDEVLFTILIFNG